MKVSKFRPRALALAMVFSGAFAGHALALDPGNPAEGAKVFKKCQACHSIVAADGNKIGPNLHGVIGRKSGSKEDFSYSDGMKSAGIVWDEATLEKYLRDPKAFVPKNKMAFAGLKKDSDLANVLAFIKQESAK